MNEEKLYKQSEMLVRLLNDVKSEFNRTSENLDDPTYEDYVSDVVAFLSRSYLIEV